MTAPPDLRDLERRPTRYWNIDGIPELVLGGVWLLWGAALLAGEAIPRGTAWNTYWLVVPAILVLSGVAANRLTVFLKQRVTYLRTGWVEMPEPRPAVRALAALVAVGAAAVVAVLVVRGRANGVAQTTPVAIGLLFSLAFLVASVRQGAPHLLALAGVALVLGIAIGALGLGWQGLNWLLVGLGVAAVALGAWRLSRYLGRYPRQEPQ